MRVGAIKSNDVCHFLIQIGGGVSGQIKTGKHSPAEILVQLSHLDWLWQFSLALLLLVALRFQVPDLLFGGLLRK